MHETLLETANGTYRWHENWITVPELDARPVNGRTHGAAVGKNGHIYIFHQAVPGMLVYDSAGTRLASWGNYPGAHGLTLVEEQGTEFLWLTDQDRLAVEKVTTDGKVVQSIAAPPYAASESYVPTWVAVNEVRHGGNGDVWVADGYGAGKVSRYDAAGNWLATIDGTEGGGRFNCPHGIWFDSRKRPLELWVADRGNHRVQVYSAEGKYIKTFGEGFLTSPDCFAVDGEQVIVPELFGRVTILDGEDGLVCHLGQHEAVCNETAWPNETKLIPGKFNSPHGATADAHHNLFVVEWRIGGRVIKLERVK